MMKGFMADGMMEGIMGASMAAGPEMIAVDIALMGIMVGIKKIKDHH